MCFSLGVVGFVLSDIFGIANPRASQILTTWISLLSNRFSKLIKWPIRNQVKKYMPKSFCRLYPQIRVIIDCTEFQIDNFITIKQLYDFLQKLNKWYSTFFLFV